MAGLTERQKRVLAAVEDFEYRAEEITPRAFWESAQAEDHPLHGEFEWDDSVAGPLYRDEQARRLLRLKVTVVHEDRVIRAPICVRKPEALTDEAGYVRTTTIVGDRERSLRVLKDELDRARRAIERAREVADALGLADRCEMLLRDLVAIVELADAAAE